MSDSVDRLRAALANRYRIERELGHGGMATVYLAEDLKHRRHVALKVLKPELAAVLGAERFVQEIATTASLQHPHILPLFDSGEADGFLYYVMPFIEGETLRDKLDRETQLGVDEAVRLATDVADALEYAHGKGVIHRDIKPENILLANGRPMVADFGIALAVSAAAGGRMTETGLSLGTPHYMSPEQATADKDITARSDIYSLASVLYEMLTGNPPHVGSSAQQIIMKIIAEPVPAVTQFRKTVPANVAAALATALEKLPADRFGSAREFAAALANPGYGLTAATLRPAATVDARVRSPVVLALAVIALLATGLAAWGWLRPPPGLPLRQYSMLARGDEAVSSAAPVLGGRLALSPDGRWLAYVGGDATLGGPAIYLRDRTSLHAVRLPATEAGRHPFFSPDGTRIGYFHADGSIHVVGVAGEPARQVGEASFNDTRGGTWGRDGYIYASARGDMAPILRMPEGGGPIEAVTTVDTVAGERQHMLPTLLPNGRGMLFTIRAGGSGGDRIGAVDLRSGKHRVLLAGLAAWYARSGHLLYVTDAGTLMAVAFDQERMEVTGSPRPVADSIGFTRLGPEVSLSDAGALVYLSGTAGYGVLPMSVDRNGKAEAIDPGWSYITTAIYSSMAVSPNGTRLVVSEGGDAGQQLHVKVLPRGPKQKLTFEGTINSRASWSGDQTIVYMSDRDGSNRIWRRVADGSAPAELILDVPANEGFVTPDGAWIIYRGIGGDRHIYARRARGDTTVLVVARSTRGEELAPALSPDGRWLAYLSTETGRGEIYLKPFPDVNRSKRLVSSDGGVEPRWSRDGRELFFRSEANELVAMSVGARGDSLTLGQPRVLFSMKEFLPPNIYQATYDVAPDASHFFMGRRLDTTAGEQLIIVENFVQHLREMVRD